MKDKNRGKSFVKNTIIIFIGTIFTKLISFLLLPLYTGFLSTSEYGTIELLNTLISLLVPIVILQFDQGAFRLMIDNRDDSLKIKQIISTSISFVILSIFVYSFLFIVISPFIYSEYKYLLFLNILVNSLLMILLQISRGFSNNIVYTIASFLTAVSTIIFNIIFLVVLNMNIDGMLIGTLLGNLLGVIYLLFSLKIHSHFSLNYFRKEVLKDLFSYSLPLVPSSISWWIFSASDRFIVSLFIGVAATGILSVSYKLSGVFIIIYNVFNTSLTESISIHIDDSDIGNYFSLLFEKIVLLFSSIGITILAFMPILFKILINGDFSEAYNLIPIAVIAFIFQVVVGLTGTVYTAKKNTKAIANTAIISAIVNLLIHFALLYFIGIYAAVVSTLVSYLIFAIYRYFDINKKYFKISFNLMKFLLICCELLFVVLVYYSSNRFLLLLGMIVSCICLFYFNKDIIKMCFKFLKNKLVL